MSLIAKRFKISCSNLFKSNILEPSLFALEGSVCVSMKIPSTPFTIPALASDSIYSGLPPVTPEIWLGL